MDDFRKRYEILQQKFQELQNRHARLKLSMDVCPAKLSACNESLEQEMLARERAQEEALMWRSRFEGVVESMPCWWFYHDTSGRLLGANGSFREFFGISDSQLDRLDLRELIPDIYQGEFDQYLGDVVDMETVEGMSRARARGGAEVVVHYLAAVEYGEEGVAGIHGFAWESKEVSSGIRSSGGPGEDWRAGESDLFSQNVLAVAEVSEFGAVIRANEKFLELSGLGARDIGEDGGAELDECVVEEDRDVVSKAFLSLDGLEQSRMDVPCRLQGSGRGPEPARMMITRGPSSGMRSVFLVEGAPGRSPDLADNVRGGTAWRSAASPAPDMDSGRPEGDGSQGGESGPGRRGWARELADGVPESFDGEITASADKVYGEGDCVPLRMAVAHFEREYILRLLGENQWHRGKVAGILGVDRRTLLRKMRAYGI
ncbi:MAG: PAS domain S-box protein [Desulfatibacillaceae bacterium]